MMFLLPPSNSIVDFYYPQLMQLRNFQRHPGLRNSVSVTPRLLEK
jgi:hypothetical protein